MVRERGYRGGPITSAISCPPSATTASGGLSAPCVPCPANRRRSTGDTSAISRCRARRPLMAFVMVLSWSRQIFLRFFPRCAQWRASCVVCRGVRGLQWMCGVLLYDNLKSAGWNVRAMPSASTRTLFRLRGSLSLRAAARSRWRAGNEKGASSAPSAMCATASSPPASSPISTTQMRRPQAWCSGLAVDRSLP